MNRSSFSKTFRDLSGIASQVFDEQLALRAMGLVYPTLLSIVPLLAVAFSVLKAFGVHTRFEIFLYYFLEPLGTKGIDISMKIIEFVENVKVGVLGSIGLSLLVYTVISQIQRLESSMNFIWHVRGTRVFSKRFANYLSIILIGPVLLFSLVGTTASIVSTPYVQRLIASPLLHGFVLAAGKLVPFLFVAAAFSLLYLLMPNTRVRFRSALTGGLLAAALWVITGWGFTSFVVTSAQYSAIYSGFATLVLFLIWLYWNFLILLVGARVSYLHQNPHFLSSGPGDLVLSGGQRERLAMTIMYFIALHFHSGRPLWKLETLASRLHMPAPVVRDHISLLKAGGFIVSTDDESAAYVPAKDLDQMSVRDIIDAVRRSPDTAPGLEQALLRHAVPAVDKVMDLIDRSVADSLGRLTMKGLVISHEDGSAKPAP